MKEINKLISDIKVIKDRGLMLTMDGIIEILENTEENNNTPELADILLDFLLHLNNKQLINNHDFDYEKEVKKFLKE